MLLDSNIIIYSAQPEHAQLRELIAESEMVLCRKYIVYLYYSVKF